jgi:hypothetical protein
VDLTPPPSSSIAYFKVNGVLIKLRQVSQGIVNANVILLPYEVAGNVVEYKLYNSTVSSEDFFVFARSPCAEQDVALSADIKWRYLRAESSGRHNRTLGRMNQSDVDRLVGPVFPALHSNEVFIVCYSSTGIQGPFVDTGFKVRTQSESTQMLIIDTARPTKPKTVNNGRIITLPKIGGMVIMLSKGYGSQKDVSEHDLISFISLTAQCNSAYDNPVVLSSSASGHIAMTTRSTFANDSFALGHIPQVLGSYEYQMCFRASDDTHFRETNLRLIITSTLFLTIQTPLGTLKPSRCDAELTAIDISVATESGITLTYFDFSTISSQLFKCTSACGVQNLESCSDFCTSWIDVSSSSLHQTLDSQALNHSVLANGRAEAFVLNSTASMRNVFVRKSAGRFRLRFLWMRDGSTASFSDEFIVTPHHLAASGIAHGQNFVVGSRQVELVGKMIDAFCSENVKLDEDDVRCQGYAELPPIEVTARDGNGDLLLLGPESAFEASVSLVQGRGAYSDSDHEPVPSGDIVFLDMLNDGGKHDDGQVRLAKLLEGTASFSGGRSLLIRRQAGNYFRIHATIRHSSASEPWLVVLSNLFSITARMKILPWAPGASAERLDEEQVQLPAHPFMPHKVVLPRVRIQLTDADGKVLRHTNCHGCLTARLRVAHNEPCETFHIRSVLPACLAEPIWKEQVS